MSQPIAKQGDKVFGIDTHMVLVPSPAGPTPTYLPHPFDGALVDKLSPDVMIDDKPVAVVGSKAKNTPHAPIIGSFARPPMNEGTVETGSATVMVNDKGVARNGDKAKCCNDPVDQLTGDIIATGTVLAK